MYSLLALRICVGDQSKPSKILGAYLYKWLNYSQLCVFVDPFPETALFLIPFCPLTFSKSSISARRAAVQETAVKLDGIIRGNIFHRLRLFSLTDALTNLVTVRRCSSVWDGLEMLHSWTVLCSKPKTKKIGVCVGGWGGVEGWSCSYSALLLEGMWGSPQGICWFCKHRIKRCVNSNGISLSVSAKRTKRWNRRGKSPLSLEPATRRPYLSACE